MGLFDSFLLKSVGTYIDHQQEKQAKHQLQKRQEEINESSFRFSDQSLERAQSLYGEDAKLGYLRPSPFTMPNWREYLTKEQWLREAHTGERFHVWNSDDLFGWNSAWGDPCEEYQKWCDANDIPVFKRHLIRFFQNPPLSQAAKQAELKKKEAESAQQKNNETTNLLMIFLGALLAVLLLCSTSQG